MKWKMMRELEHIHKHLDQVENEYENQPYSILQACRKERVPVKEEVDDYYGTEYD